MHYHCEIILPPSAAEEVENVVRQVLAPFDEEPDEDGYRHTSSAFWDYWTIGGRWSGTHVQQRHSPERMEAFYAALRERKVTVSGLQFGKQELQPASQIPEVDALWHEMFPDSGLEHCPLFHHSSPKNRGTLPGDVCRVDELGEFSTASRLIFVGPHWKDEGKYVPKEMLQSSFWNGVSHIDSTWDGKVASGIEWMNGKLKGCRPEHAEKNRVADDWLAVTVDYHS